MVAWEATYLLLGGVFTATGANSELRFPHQWFQSESGLHQNWMRDYDPTTGRYIQADPLGLVDGASVYGYALQNPGRHIDPRGECVGPLAYACGGIIVGAATSVLIGYLLDEDCYTYREAASDAFWGGGCSAPEGLGGPELGVTVCGGATRARAIGGRFRARSGRMVSRVEIHRPGAVGGTRSLILEAGLTAAGFLQSATICTMGIVIRKGGVIGEAATGNRFVLRIAFPTGSRALSVAELREPV
ncbi:RHS repeat-associated core domain-containing protein [Aliiroseovarius sp.]|uniref:RHS repeat-associated core domain-containing protein n=1 Tax=Aliiroseovarius sp. TaxID=1872442 RepID=UPI003BACCA6A